MTMSETYVYVKPALKKIRGAKEATPLKIRDPQTGQMMPDYGARVLRTTAISRMLLPAKENACRIQRGPDLLKTTKEAVEAGKAKAAAAKAAAKKPEKAAPEAEKAAPEAEKAAPAPKQQPKKADK